ncbi:conserved hypothetical protein [Burkholderia pseudomallei 668]|nr:lipocalin-like domain-containing protein [Burkholderia pseudomallei]ABN83556.1 conserved hypothetical protein [Burkholderia pseudomallei 668]
MDARFVRRDRRGNRRAPRAVRRRAARLHCLYGRRLYVRAIAGARTRAVLRRRSVRGTPAEYAQAGRTYLAYAGRFFVDEATRALSHEMAVALFPNWLGQIQTRTVEFPDDTLHLGMPTPLQLNDALKHARLVWRRATPNG